MTQGKRAEPPTFQDVLRARNAIAPYLSPTPLVSYPALDEMLGARAYVKREDTQPIAAFKVRGGINLMAHLPEEERRRGVVTASTGNHGQSIAYASRVFGARCVVVVPEGANPLKVAAMERLGADVSFHGRTFDDSREHAEQLAKEEGLRYIHPANEPLLIAGVATATLEMLEAAPDLDFLFVALGGGSTATGACIVAGAVNPDLRVIAVQSAQAPAGHRSWTEGAIRQAPMRTIAEGLATGTGFELPQSVLRERLAGFLLVDDADLNRAVRVYVEACHALSEPAGAAALAGALQARDRLRGARVGLVLSGANITVAQLRDALGGSPPL